MYVKYSCIGVDLPEDLIRALENKLSRLDNVLEKEVRTYYAVLLLCKTLLD